MLRQQRAIKTATHSLLRPQACCRICHLDAEYFGPTIKDRTACSAQWAEVVDDRTIPFKDHRSVAAANIVCDLCRIRFIVHEENLKLAEIADEELFKTIREEMTRLLVATVANLPQAEQAKRTRNKTELIRLTEGIGSCPLKRRLTRLSIPFGFRHASFTPW